MAQALTTFLEAVCINQSYLLNVKIGKCKNARLFIQNIDAAVESPQRANIIFLSRPLTAGQEE